MERWVILLITFSYAFVVSETLQRSLRSVNTKADNDYNFFIVLYILVVSIFRSFDWLAWKKIHITVLMPTADLLFTLHDSACPRNNQRVYGVYFVVLNIEVQQDVCDISAGFSLIA